jgi:AcrR family transcriptional regulator
VTESRSVLLDAAAEEFARYGLLGARVQAIVKRAGVNERMIYHHFGSKEGLYRAVLDDERAALGAAWSPYLDRAITMNPYDGLRSVFSALFDIFAGRPRLVAMLTHEWLSGAGTNSMPPVADLPQQVRTLYERGQRDGLFEAGRPFDVAYAATVGALVGQSVFLPRFAEANGLGPDQESLRDLVIGQLLDGLTGPR